jgi:signal transduction histidine kinase
MRALSFSSPRSTWIAAGILAALLGVLAALQYRWIGEVSRAERQRLQVRLDTAAEHFGDDLAREVSRAFFAFQPGVLGRKAGNEPSVAERWRRWRETAPQPSLVRDVYVVEGRDGHYLLTRIDPATDQAVPAPWPDELLTVRRRLEEGDGGAVPPFPMSFAFDTAVPAIIAPLHHMFAPGEKPVDGIAIAMLDRRFLQQELFPELAERWFNVSRTSDYLVAVKGPSGLVYRSDPSLPETRYLPGDLSTPILGLHREARRLARERPPDRARSGVGPPPGRTPRRKLPESPWRLVITHREGSLEAAVAGVRMRNLAVSLGVLILLAVTLLVLTASAQRARDLARQQIEFVAGLTHELNTPLAAIRSAGQNLADGVVGGAQQVARYGALIEREGRRLSGMVAKALELAGIQSGNKTYRAEPVQVAEVVDQALADCRWVLQENGVVVERDVAPDLPAVSVDRGALRMVIQNLLDNAVKYAGTAAWIGIRARAGRDGREVSLIVEDHGPGIRAEDRPHLFEPFYRGREVSGGAVHGSGLGLSLVRHAVIANRGSLSVVTGPGGSAFTIRLPAAASPSSVGVPVAVEAD